MHVVYAAARALGVELEYYEQERQSLVETRNRILQEVRKAHPDDKTLNVLWLDDDILIPSSENLAAMIYQAEEHHYNLVAPYKILDPSCKIHAQWWKPYETAKCTCVLSYSHLAKKRSLYSQDEVRALKPYDLIPFAGLGCYYGEMPLYYKFHLAPEGEQIEDVLFFEENPQIVLRHFPLPLKHLKEFPI